MKRNIKLLQEVTDWLAAGAPHVKINEQVSLNGFDYSSWITVEEDATIDHCGTMACIAGAAVEFGMRDITIDPDRITFTSERLPSVQYLTGISGRAQWMLGLTEEQKRLLFYPFEINNMDLRGTRYFDPDLGAMEEPLDWTRHLKPEQIAVVLQHFIDTGEIDWHKETPNG